jgi:DNA invertase Pin-like site-specific DNA recombinase
MRVTEPRFKPARRRAVGIIRVSEVAGRGGDAFRSPADQRAIMERHCDSRTWSLVATFEELDVSGFSLKELHQRKRGLAPAVAMIERGEADILLLPWLDRIARELTLFRTVRKRVVAAGGSIEAVDFGDVSGGSAAQRFSAETLIRVAEFFAELTAEKTHGAQEGAIAAGIPTFSHIPFGYRKHPETRRLVVHEQEAAAVRRAYDMREEGSTLEEIRDYLRSQDCRYGIRGVQKLLSTRIYLGELHFGKLSNLHAHEAIIKDPAKWRAVQGMRVARGNGERKLSERLLARLGILRCAKCKNALVVGGQVRMRGRGPDKQPVHYVDYRCSSMRECTDRVAVSAQVVEQLVVAYVKQADAEGHASIDERTDAAEKTFREAEQALSLFTEMFTGIGDMQATQKKLAELKANREQAYERWQVLRAARGTAGVRAADWDSLTFSDQRTLIRSTIREIEVRRGRAGAYVEERISIKPFEQ